MSRKLPPLPETNSRPSRLELTMPSDLMKNARLLPLDLIDQNPSQFRQTFSPDSIRELADSIAEIGVLEPLIVRARGDRYELVAGERRLRALRLLHEEGNPKSPVSVPSIVRDMDDAEAVLAIAAENLQREDLTLADEAVMYERLVNVLSIDTVHEISNRELGRRIGINHNRIGRIRRLARYPSLLAAVMNGEMTLMQGVKQTETIDTRQGGLALQSDAGEASTLIPREEADGQAIVSHRETPTTDDNRAFTVQHVHEYQRRVPGKAWQPFYSAVRNMSQLWNNEPAKLVHNLAPEDFEDVKVKALQAREQLDRLLAELEKAEE